MEKQCARCGKMKDISEFSKNSRNADKLHSYCKECNAEKAKEYNKTDKGKNNVIKAQKKQVESGYFRYGKGAISNMSISAQKRGIQFNLNEEDLKKWWMQKEDNCYYCGISIDEYRIIRDFIQSYEGDDWNINRFKRFFKLENQAKINDMTIDRVDNSRGYEIDNIVKSCWFRNSMKSDFYTREEMLIIGKAILSSLRKIMEEQKSES